MQLKALITLRFIPVNNIWDKLFMWSIRFLLCLTLIGALFSLIVDFNSISPHSWIFWWLIAPASILYVACIFYLLVYVARTEGKKTLANKDVNTFRLVRDKK